MQRTSKYRPRRMNMYVASCGYAADVIHAGPFEVVFGPMAVASATNILSGQSIASATNTSTLLQDNTDPVNTSFTADFPNGPGFGRCLQFVASGASTSVVTVRGRDYLGQPMTEAVTLNGATPVIGVKAFKWIDNIAWTATSATTMNVGTTDKLGLPYRMQNVTLEMLDGARVSTLGTFVGPSYTDPATATTTDPRGTYDPNSTLTGSAILSAVFLPNSKVNSNGNGGLYGLPHYYA
jgi:hypothetical protein